MQLENYIKDGIKFHRTVIYFDLGRVFIIEPDITVGRKTVFGQTNLWENNNKQNYVFFDSVSKYIACKTK